LLAFLAWHSKIFVDFLEGGFVHRVGAWLLLLLMNTYDFVLIVIEHQLREQVLEIILFFFSKAVVLEVLSNLRIV